MKNKNAPLFRKAGRGYNKDDVNNYIIGLNRNLSDSKEYYERMISELNAKATQDQDRINELTNALCEQERICKGFTAEISRLTEVETESYAKDEEIISLRLKITELEEAKARETDNSNKEKAEYYESICSKAGEILFIASDTAEDILNRADAEAKKIVGEANNKKDLMLKTFSDSVDEAAGDINSYIRKAVDDCIGKINKSVDEVSRMAKKEIPAPKAETPTSKKEAPKEIKRPRMIYVNKK